MNKPKLAICQGIITKIINAQDEYRPVMDKPGFPSAIASINIVEIGQITVATSHFSRDMEKPKRNLAPFPYYWNTGKVEGFENL